MIEYKGTKITISESTKFDEEGFTVANDYGLVFKAESRFGKSYASDSETALQGAKDQVDKASQEA